MMDIVITTTHKSVLIKAEFRVAISEKLLSQPMIRAKSQKKGRSEWEFFPEFQTSLLFQFSVALLAQHTFAQTSILYSLVAPSFAWG